VERSLLKMAHLSGGSGPLVLPCVRSTTGCVSCHLTTKEISNALDLPATLPGSGAARIGAEEPPATGPIVPSKNRSYVAEAILELINPAAGDDESIVSGLTMVTQSTSRSHTSIKYDTAAVPSHLWDERLGLHGKRSGPAVELGRIRRGLKWLRAQLHAICCKRMGRSFWQWVIKEKAECAKQGREFDKQVYAPGLAAIDYALQSDWWEWKEGSAPFFLRWPTHCMQEIWDGLPPRFIGPPPSYRWLQRVPVEKDTVEKIRAKLPKFRRRGYISKGLVESLMSLFKVPKGLTDIHIVFDSTAYGLNDVLLAPWFWIPTVKTQCSDLWTLDIGQPTMILERCFIIFGYRKHYGISVVSISLGFSPKT
jgi:hypothetical protein